MAINSILLIIAAILVLMIIVLTFIYLSMTAKEKQEQKKKEEKEGFANSKIAKSYSVGSIFDFMEFDKVEDNMIIQKDFFNFNLEKKICFFNKKIIKKHLKIAKN